VYCRVVDRIRLSEPQSPGTAWFLDQLISASTVIKLLFDLLTDASIVSRNTCFFITLLEICSPPRCCDLRQLRRFS